MAHPKIAISSEIGIEQPHLKSYLLFYFELNTRCTQVAHLVHVGIKTSNFHHTLFESMPTFDRHLL